MDVEQLTAVLAIGLFNGLIVALVAIGYTLVYGIIELINFAHADVFMLGTAFTYFATNFIVGRCTASVIACRRSTIASSSVSPLRSSGCAEGAIPS